MSVTTRDVRQLLRALGNPVALKRDELAARLVGRGKNDPTALQERGDRLIAVLRASLAAMCTHAGPQRSNDRIRRAARIVERCDLEGCSHAAVAREIGLARRQFYRDRALALGALAIELEDVLRARVPHAGRAAESVPLAFEAAETMVGIGRYDDAEAVLERVLATAHNADDRVRAAARLLEAAVESGDRRRQRRALERVQPQRGRLPNAPAARIRFELASLQAKAELGVPADAAQRACLLDELRARNDSDDERWEVLAWGLSQCAIDAHTRGDFATALASLHEAEAVLRRCEAAPLTLPALLPNLLGVTLMMLPQSLDAASEQHKRAVAIARPRGLLRIVAASTLNDFAIDLWEGRADRVIAPALDMLETARTFSSTDEFGRLSILVAKIALGAGRLELAVRLLETVRDGDENLPRLRPRAMLAKAEALLSAGEFGRASAAAHEALGAIRRSGELSLVGTALLLDAEALIGTQRRGLARKTLAEALETLERSGSAHALDRAHRLVGRLGTA